MNETKIKTYTIRIDGENFKLPYCEVTSKVIKFKNMKSFNKLLDFYIRNRRRGSKDELNPRYKYRSSKKKMTLYRITDEQHYTFEQKKRNVKNILQMDYRGTSFEDYLNEERNWKKGYNKKILTFMGNYLLINEDKYEEILTGRQIRYIKEKEETVYFSEEFEEEMAE